MTWAEYFALPAESWSRLKLLRESPAHYRYALERPSEDTPTLALGRYVHTAILSPDLLSEDFAVYPGARRAGKEWDAFAAAHNGRTIFRADEIEGMPLAMPMVVDRA